MRYYVEINGISSLTLTGFAIKELPPISKPPIRTQKDEIDGRDGDIITKLGYGAYDKQIEVGLYGNDYDINEIISFFNSEGIITFSNEPDKYYNFTIVNQIDFEKLLKFKTATITFHCQPFKYKKNEEPIEVEYQYVSGEGTEITLDNTDEAALKMELFGNTEQFATEGLNIYYMNYADRTDPFHNTTITSTHTGFSITGTFDASSTAFTLINRKMTLSAGTYTLKLKKISSLRLGISKTNYAAIARINIGSISKTFTLTEETEVCLTLELSLNTQYNESNELMIYSGTEDKEWEPYTGGVPSPNPQYPQDIQVVSGDNEIQVCGKNLFDKSKVVTGYLIENGTIYDTLNYNTSDYIIVEPNTSYYKTATSSPRTKYYDKNKQPLNTTTYQDISIGGNEGTFTTPNNAYYLKFSYPIATIDANSIMLHKGTTATTYEPYQGNTYNIDLPVENLISFSNISDNTSIGVSSTIDGESITLNGTTTASGNIIAKTSTSIVLKAGVYTGSITTSGSFTRPMGDVAFYLRKSNTINGMLTKSLTFMPTDGQYSSTFTLTEDTEVFLEIFANASNISFNNYVCKFQIEAGEKPNSYTPFGTKPIEMCMMPNTDYKDGFEYDVNEDKWYKNAVINQTIFDGSEDENWIERSSTSTDYWKVRFDGALPTFIKGRLDIKSNYFIPNGGANDAGYEGNAICGNSGQYANWLHISIDKTIANSVDNFKTWLSMHNLKVYYLQATSTKEEITYAPLLEQLNALLEAIAKKEQTNINQINNDLPFYIKAKTIEKGSDTATIINDGNIYSKPILNVIGEGNVGVSLNGNQIFNLDLSNPNAITIDTNKLEAYNPNSLNLMNRKVIGDIANLKLPEGTNELKFDGALTKATITNYSRWL